MEDRFVIIDTAGRAHSPKDGSTWFSILEATFAVVQSAGGSTALPNMLLRNGVVEVEKGLHQIAWEYGTLRRKTLSEAAIGVEGQYPAPWL